MSSSTRPVLQAPQTHSQDLVVGQDESSQMLVDPSGLVTKLQSLGLKPGQVLALSVVFRGMGQWMNGMEAKVGGLGEEVSDLTSRNEHLEEESEKRKGENTELKEQVQNLTTQHEKIEKENGENKAKVTAAVLSNQRLHSKIDQMNRNREQSDRKAAAEMRRTREDALYTSMTGTRNALIALRDRFTKLDKRIDRLVEAFEGTILQSDYADLRGCLQNCKQKIGSRLETFHTELAVEKYSRTSETFNTLKGEFESDMQDTAAFETSKDQCVQDVSALKNRLATREKNLATREKNIEALEKLVGKYEGQESLGLVQQVADLQTSIADLQSKAQSLGAAEQKKQQWAQTLTDLSLERDTLAVDCATNLANCKALSQKLKEGDSAEESELTGAEESFGKSQTKFGNVVRDLGEISKNVSEAEGAIKLRKQVSTKLKEIPPLLARVEKVRQKLAKLKSERKARKIPQGWEGAIESHKSSLTQSEAALKAIDKSCKIILGFEQPGEISTITQLRQDFDKQSPIIANLTETLTAKESIATSTKTIQDEEWGLEGQVVDLGLMCAQLKKEKQPYKSEQDLKKKAQIALGKLYERVDEGWKTLGSTKPVSKETAQQFKINAALEKTKVQVLIAGLPSRDKIESVQPSRRRGGGNVFFGVVKGVFKGIGNFVVDSVTYN